MGGAWAKTWERAYDKHIPAIDTYVRGLDVEQEGLAVAIQYA